jgi:acyl-coenzyme A thioesterase PaaI-like protein
MPIKKKIPKPNEASPYDLTVLYDVPPSEDRIRRMLDIMVDHEKQPTHRSWMAELLPYLTVVSSAQATADKGPSVVFRLEVQYFHSNAIGQMQGGCVSTLLDYVTSLSLGLISKPGFWFFTGVTRTMTFTLLRPIPVEEAILIESDVVHAGKRLAHLRGRITRESDGAVLAVCQHDKVNTDPSASAMITAKSRL